jgi:hypothetical protein
MKTVQLIFGISLLVLTSHCASSCSDQSKDKSNEEPVRAAPGAGPILRDTHIRLPRRGMEGGGGEPSTGPDAGT